MAATTPNKGGRTTAASKRAAAAATAAGDASTSATGGSTNGGRPRRAAVGASPYGTPTSATTAAATPPDAEGATAAAAAASSSKGKAKATTTTTNGSSARDSKSPTTSTKRKSSTAGKAAEVGAETALHQAGPTASSPGQAVSDEDDVDAEVDGPVAGPSGSHKPSPSSSAAPTTDAQAAGAQEGAGALAPPFAEQLATSSGPATEPAPALAAVADSIPPRPEPTASAASTTSSTSSSLRKSVRSTRAKGIDYANLDQHLPASVDRWISTIEARTKNGQIVSGFATATDSAPGSNGKGGWRRFKDGNELERLGDEWIYGATAGAGAGGVDGASGMTEPFVVEKPDGLGMEMPKGRLSVRQVADFVGPDTPLEVIDCASQSSLANWTLGQWADYYDDPDRDKVRNVISLEVSETKLGRMVVAPKLVRQLDWVDTIWPEDMKVPGEYPRVQKYCLMSVERCWTDWHVDFAGSSVFYHVLRGGKTFFFIRPTPENLKAYEEWSGSSEKQEQTWLGDMVDQVYRLDLEEGNTAFIPTGWIHAVYTPSDSLVIGGNFLHSLNIPTQLRVYEIEIATKVPRKFRYPHFVKLLWFVAQHYHARLAAPSLLDTPVADRPAELRSPRVLQGLRQLSSFLIQQTTRFARGAQVSAERKRIARENVPWSKVPDPVALSREFRKVVLRALGENLDAECFLPHTAQVGHEDEKSNGVAMPGGGSGGGVKRKASEAAMEGPGLQAALSAKIKRTASNPYSPSAFVPSYNPNGTLGDGEIIGRHTVPVVSVTRTEERIDPGSVAAPTGPNGRAVMSEVKESRTTQSVVRRWVSDPLDPTGRSGPVVETRTVVTIVERVKFPHPSMVPHVQAKPYARYEVTADSAYGQVAGIGPPAPPSITAVPGSVASVSHPRRSSNAEPYQPYGWPYQYDLPNSSLPTPPPPPIQQQQPQQQPAHSQQPAPRPAQVFQQGALKSEPGRMLGSSVGMDNMLQLPPLPNPPGISPTPYSTNAMLPPPPPSQQQQQQRRPSFQAYAPPSLPQQQQQQQQQQHARGSQQSQAAVSAYDARMAEHFGFTESPTATEPHGGAQPSIPQPHRFY